MCNLPPLSASQFKLLRADVKDIPATARRKNFTLDRWEQQQEEFAAKHYFALGCWLFYYRNDIYKTGCEGLQSRIDCLYKILASGLNNPGYQFFTVFQFGERQFDTLIEMGDADTVIEHVRRRYHATPNKNVQAAFEYMGWSLHESRPINHGQLELIL